MSGHSEDLTRVSAEVADPLRVSFRGWRVFTQPPISQGVVLSRALGLVDGCFSAGLHIDEAMLWPLTASALRQAFAERLALLGDGDDRRARADALLRGTVGAHQRRPHGRMMGGRRRPSWSSITTATRRR